MSCSAKSDLIMLSILLLIVIRLIALSSYFGNNCRGAKSLALCGVSGKRNTGCASTVAAR